MKLKLIKGGILGLIITVLFCVTPSLATARVFTPPSSGSGIYKNPDGTWTEWFQFEIKGEYHYARGFTYSGEEYDSMGRQIKGLELETGTTGQDASEVPGLDLNESMADKEMALRLRTGAPYESAIESTTGDDLIAADEGAGTLPAFDTVLAGVSGAAASGGAFLIGVGIGDGIDELVGLPNVSSIFGVGSEGAGSSGYAYEKFFHWLPGTKIGETLKCSLLISTYGLEIPPGPTTGECAFPEEHYETEEYEIERAGKPVNEYLGGSPGPYVSTWASSTGEPPCPAQAGWIDCQTYGIPAHNHALTANLSGSAKHAGFPAPSCSECQFPHHEPEVGAKGALSPEELNPVDAKTLPQPVRTYVETHDEKTLLPGVEEGEIVTVPNCNGLLRTACEERMETVGLIPEISPLDWEHAVLTKPADAVIETKPDEGEERKVGTYIDIITNPLVMPKVIPPLERNEPLEKYEEHLEKEGFHSFESKEATEVNSATGPGDVTAVNPASGTRIDPSTEPKVEVETNPDTAPEPEGGFSGPTLPGIKFPKLGVACTAFPFGVPCWIVKEFTLWSATSKTPEWEVGGYKVRSTSIPSAKISLAFLEPVMVIVRPFMILFSTIGLVIVFYRWSTGKNVGTSGEGESFDENNAWHNTPEDEGGPQYQ